MKRDPLLKRVKRFCAVHSFWGPEDLVLVALSGGIDSAVLTHMLLQILGPERLTAMHVNHGIRGEEAERDHLFVEELCRNWGVRLVVKRLDAPAAAEKRGLGLEEAARFVRREALASVAKRIGAECIATGHNLNDHVETMLVKLIQGTGPRGICGMAPRQGPFVRPMLEVPRSEILRYAERMGVPFVSDSTNQDTSYLHNWVRHRVIPLLTERNPGFLQVAKGLSQVTREQVELCDHLTEEAWNRCSGGEEGVVYLELAALAAHHTALQRMVVLRFLNRAFPGRRMTRAHVLQVHSLVQGDAGSFVGVPGGTVVREGDRLVALKVPQRKKGGYKQERVFPCTLEKMGTYRWGGFLWGVRLSEGPVSIDPWRGVALSARLVSLPLLLRCRRPGDRLYRRGVGHKKVKKIMQEKRVPVALRERIPLLVDPSENRVLWVAGLGADSRLAPAPGEPALVIEREEEGSDG